MHVAQFGDDGLGRSPRADSRGPTRPRRGRGARAAREPRRGPWRQIYQGSGRQCWLPWSMDRPLPVLRGERVRAAARPRRRCRAAARDARRAGGRARGSRSWDEARVRRDLIARAGRRGGAGDRGGRRGRRRAARGRGGRARLPLRRLDIGLAAAHQGRGLGPEAMRLVIDAHDRGARPPPLHDRPGGGQRAGDPRLRGGRLPARRRDAPLRARRRRHAGTTAC